jgi:hypothetical protein
MWEQKRYGNGLLIKVAEDMFCDRLKYCLWAELEVQVNKQATLYCPLADKPLPRPQFLSILPSLTDVSFAAQVNTRMSVLARDVRVGKQ